MVWLNKHLELLILEPAPYAQSSDPNVPAQKPSNAPVLVPKRWSWPAPGPLDVIWLSHLKEFEPFAYPKHVVEQFYQCQLYIKASLALHPARFKKMSNVCNTSTLRNRYEHLKKWLKHTKAVTKRSSGTQETDGKLRELIGSFVIQEEEMKNVVRKAKDVKEAAVDHVARANDLRAQFAGRQRSAPAQVGPAGDEEGEIGLDEGEGGNWPATTFWALQNGLTKKLQGDNRLSHIVDVTLKSSQAADCANELTMVALEKYERQAELENAQQELTATTSFQANKDKQIGKLKNSVSAVQGTLSDMGSLLKLLADQLPPTHEST
ncbi:hypothetical protein DFH28DRAFT_1129046 [Melampsora americana]|nr:hypothetical protein DFH28DRAFT_1129046 [Melampsora americana]